MRAVWDEYVPTEELERLRASGFGQSDLTPPSRPCLLVIDVVLSFLGRRPAVAPGSQGDATDGEEPDTGAEYVTTCGPESWERLPAIRSLLDTARTADLPRVLTKGSAPDTAVVGGAIKLLHDRALARSVDEAPFPVELEPREGDYVLTKTRASAFFQTPLLMYLHQHQADAVVIVGTTTSGCVRATAVDAASYGFDVYVVEDACFDRSPFVHASNLFDIQMKYGEVIDSAAARRLLTADPVGPGD